VDIVHPAHVHFYRHLIGELLARGDKVEIVARHKDVTTALLDSLGLPYRAVGEHHGGSRLGLAWELLRRDLALVRAGLAFRPDVVLTRNPSGTHAARLVGAIAIFDTDDGSAVGLHFRAAAPFAHIITTPASITEDFGAKHRRYPGYKPLAYLHPDRFTPDPAVRAELGVAQNEPYALVRFVSWGATHDRGEEGLDLATKRRLVDELEKCGRVFITSESALEGDMARRRFPLPPHRLHDAMAFASVCAGDSQTMAFEAGLLGTPSFRCNSFAGRLETMEDIERRYDLVRSFGVADSARFLAGAAQAGADPAVKAGWGERRAEMLADAVDVTRWYLDLLDEVCSRQRGTVTEVGERRRGIS